MSINLPPFALQTIIPSLTDQSQISCAQALGSEIYIGSATGTLWRYALQAESNGKENYMALSEMEVVPGKPIDQIVLLPSIMRALVVCDQTLYFYQLPTLAPVNYTLIRPLRGIVSIAPDYTQLSRPSLASSAQDSPLRPLPIDFCAIKRSHILNNKLSIVLYSIRDKLATIRELPFPDSNPPLAPPARLNRTCCLSIASTYSLIDLEANSNTPLIPVNQDFDHQGPALKPHVLPIPLNPPEYLVASHLSDGNTVGVFFSLSGDPVRGTLQWPAYPLSLSLEHPYVVALLPNQTIEIHNIEGDQSIDIAQVIPAPSSLAVHRTTLASVAQGYLVPSHARSEKLALKKVGLLRTAQSQ